MDDLGSADRDRGDLGVERPGLASALEDLVCAGQRSDRGDAFSGAVLHLAGNQAGGRERSADRANWKQIQSSRKRIIAKLNRGGRVGRARFTSGPTSCALSFWRQ